MLSLKFMKKTESLNLFLFYQILGDILVANHGTLVGHLLPIPVNN